MKVWVENLDFQDNRSFLRDFDIYAQIKKYFRPLIKILFGVSIFSLSSGDPIFPFNLPSKQWLPGHDAKSGFQIATESSSKWTVQNIRIKADCFKTPSCIDKVDSKFLSSLVMFHPIQEYRPVLGSWTV